MTGDSPTDRGPVPRAHAQVLILDPPRTPADVAAACEELRRLLRADNRTPITVICDVSAITAPDALALDVLARMQLTARRLGSRITIARSSDRLRELLLLTGLEAALPREEDDRVDPALD